MIFFVFLFLQALCFAGPADTAGNSGSLVSPGVWELMRNAEFSFDKGDIGEALLLNEKARDLHRSEIKSMAETLKRDVSYREIKRLGDNISSVYQALSSRGYSGAEVMDRVFKKHPPSFFSNSLSALIAWLDGASALPEADVFAGRVYEAEGEYSLAFSFYEKAWENRAFFDVPGDSTLLVYHMADLAGLTGNPGARENYLLLALTGDPVFGTPGKESGALLAMMRTAKEDIEGPQGSSSGVSGSGKAVSPAFVKFFSLYRNNNPLALKAYMDLTDFYYRDSGKRLDRALATGCLSAVTAFTLLENAVREYEYGYSYSSFGETLRTASKYSEIREWAASIHLWDSFLQFASVLYDSGAQEFAAALWMNLSIFCPDGRVAGKAASAMNISLQP